MSPDFGWFSNLEKIRNRVHEASAVPMLHVNEEEAKKKALRLEIQRLRYENVRLLALTEKQAKMMYEDKKLFKKLDSVAKSQN